MGDMLNDPKDRAFNSLGRRAENSSRACADQRR